MSYRDITTVIGLSHKRVAQKTRQLAFDKRAESKQMVVALVGPLRARQHLSLGTSLAAGSQIDPLGGTTNSSDESYTDQLYQRVKGRIGAALVHERLVCPGETTDQFSGGTNVFGQPSACSGTYTTGSQLGDALAATAEGNVDLITIDIGANDLTHTQIVCGGDPSCIVASIPAIASKVAQIVGTPRAAGYTGPILGMNYYNPGAAAAIGFFHGVAGQQAPDPAFAGFSDLLIKGFNGALTQSYTAFGAEVVDVYTAFNSGDFGDDAPVNGIPDNVDVLCQLSYMCPEDPDVRANFHLDKHGYRVIAKAFLAEVMDVGG